MKKLLLTAVLIAGFSWYAVLDRNQTKPLPLPEQVAIRPADNTPTSPTPTTTAAASPSSGWRDGTYTGPVADAFYGPLQVEAVIENGRLADVKVVRYPDDRPESIQVNEHSNPLLRAEALSAQTAAVDIISGATQSSEAFQKSLAAALSQAE